MKKYGNIPQITQKRWSQVLISLGFCLLWAMLLSCEVQSINEIGLLVPPTVKEDPSLPSISINGRLLHSETFGNSSDPMLVMLHGGPGGDYRSLLKNSAFSAEGYYVVFYDQTGSGLSERVNANVFTTQLFVDELNSVINYYRTSTSQQIVLVGQSWGAMLAAAYVNQYPENIDGLILTEPGGFTWKDTKDYIDRSQKLDLLGEATNDMVYQDQFFTGNDHIILDYKAMLTSAADINVGNSGLTPFWRKGAVCSSACFKYVKENPFDFTTNLENFPTRILFGYSQLNGAYGREHALKVSSAFPNVQLVEFLDTGHSIPYYGWDDYFQTALVYLEEVL